MTEAALAREKANTAAQESLRLVWECPGIGFAFSTPTAAEQALQALPLSRYLKNDALAMDPCRQAAFRCVASAILRGHFVWVARAFALWHIWTLIWHPPELSSPAYGTVAESR